MQKRKNLSKTALTVINMVSGLALSKDIDIECKEIGKVKIFLVRKQILNRRISLPVMTAMKFGANGYVAGAPLKGIIGDLAMWMFLFLESCHEGQEKLNDVRKSMIEHEQRIKAAAGKAALEIAA